MADTKLLIMLDCDGTLGDSLGRIVGYMQQAWGAHKFSPIPEGSAIGATIGLRLPEAIARLDGSLTHQQIEAIADAYVDAANVPAEDTPPLFQGMRQVIEALHSDGHQIGIATGMGRGGLQKFLSHHDLLQTLSPLKTADDGRGKPDPDILLQAMAETAALPEHTIMIGDSIYDMQMAVSAKCHALGVSWGYGSQKNLLDNGAKKVVNNAQEILHFCQHLIREPQ